MAEANLPHVLAFTRHMPYAVSGVRSGAEAASLGARFTAALRASKPDVLARAEARLAVMMKRAARRIAAERGAAGLGAGPADHDGESQPESDSEVTGPDDDDQETAADGAAAAAAAAAGSARASGGPGRLFAPAGSSEVHVRWSELMSGSGSGSSSSSSSGAASGAAASAAAAPAAVAAGPGPTSDPTSSLSGFSFGFAFGSAPAAAPGAGAGAGAGSAAGGSGFSFGFNVQ